MKCFAPRLVPDPRYGGQTMFVPCRKCISCIKRYVNEWIIRLVDEAENSEGINIFLTLTYEQEPDSYSKEHCLTFIKKLRNVLFNNKIRYFIVGERGSLTHRHHYHALIFSDVNPQNKEAYYSLLERSWNHGFIKASPITPKTCAYTAKYITPVNNGDKFMLMSRGLGRKRITSKMVESYENRPRHYFVQNGYKRPLPRYYKRKLQEHAIVFPTYDPELTKKQFKELDNYLEQWDAYDRKQLFKKGDSYRVQQQKLATETFNRQLSEKQRSKI